MKLTTLTEIYLRERKLAKETEAHFRFVVRLFVKDMNITEVQMVTHESLLLWRGIVLGRNSRSTTWNNYLRHMQILIKYAHSRDYMHVLPSTSLLYVSSYDQRPKTVHIRDLKIAMDLVRSEKSPFQPNWFWNALIRTFFFTGMRRRQLAGLRWKNVDFTDNTIQLESSTSKTKREWFIPMPVPVAVDLAVVRSKTIDILGEEDENFKDRYVFDIQLFNSLYHCENRLHESTISNFFKRLSNRTGIRVSAHRLRHTMATELATQGKYKELQYLLGHASVHTTMRYIHPEMAQIRNLVNTLNDIDL